MYVQRLLKKALDKAIAYFPAVLITGPRQSGKTTFLKHGLDSKQSDYVSFDDPLERDFARRDPNGFLNRFQKSSIILDEIQYVPELLQYLKMRIDQSMHKKEQWILTSSQQFQLMHEITESLAGRIAILELLPFSILELQTHLSKDLSFFLWYGEYPEPVLNAEEDKRNIWLRSYVQTYIERDLRQLHHVHNLSAFERFISLMAARHAQLSNASALAREIGISAPMIKSWETLLKAAYICYFLPPYFKNYNKRITKSSKMYFIDAALVAFLTRQPSMDALLAGAMGEAFFEGFIISEAIKIFASLGRKPDLFFWRSRDGLKVDLLIQTQGRLYPVEIKMTATPTLQHLESLDKFRKIAGKDAAETGVLVCRAAQKTVLSNNNLILPWQEFPEWLLTQLQQ